MGREKKKERVKQEKEKKEKEEKKEEEKEEKEEKEQEEEEDRGVFSNWDQNAAASAPALLPNPSCPSNAIQCKIQLQLHICTIVQNTILKSDNEMKILRYNTAI